MNKVDIFSLNNKFKVLENEVKKTVKLALTHLNKKDVRLEVYLISDEKIQSLNKKFRGKDKSTNVLSFEEKLEKWPYPESRLLLLGEIYLAPDYIQRQGENLSRLTIHGLLHLLGYTHAKKSDRIKMEQLEDKIFSYG